MKQTNKSSKTLKSSVKYLATGVVVATAIGLGVSAVQAESWSGGHGSMMGQSGQMGGVAMGNGPMSNGRMRHGQGMQPGQFIEGRLAFLKTELGINEAQRQAWDDFAGFMRSQAESMKTEVTKHQAEWQQKMHNNNQANSADSPLDHMQQRITHMQERTARMQAGLEAMKSLYGALTPEQQAKAKTLMGRMGSHMGPMGHRGQYRMM